MRRIGLTVILAVSFLTPLAVEAQQAVTPRIAFLVMGLYLRSMHSVKDLRELGWSENENIVIEYRWAGETPNRLPELAPTWSSSRWMSSSAVPLALSPLRA